MKSGKRIFREGQTTKDSTPIAATSRIIRLSLGALLISLLTACPTPPEPEEGMDVSEFRKECFHKGGIYNTDCEGKPVIMLVQIFDDPYASMKELDVHALEAGELKLRLVDELSRSEAYPMGRGFKQYDTIKFTGYATDDPHKIKHVRIYKLVHQAFDRPDPQTLRMEAIAEENKRYREYTDSKHAELSAKATSVEVKNSVGILTRIYHMPDGHAVTCHTRMANIGAEMTCFGE